MFIVKNLNNCNYRFNLFCKAHSLSEGDEWVTWEYITWITRNVNEFKKIHGLNEFDALEKLDDGQTRFDNFLQVQV
ncbi:hypothetical protein COL77_29390 [Bacillus wiedmannii]|uniref:hypothetical protein n=1 Tax=Bacillus wiedmannii TaxID=1890302 RepID=UPI000BF2C6A3|nr:hypothetical protein [Bacillus wiedmannii]PFZ35484.1 hypothetical protein COL77_29390 [Bacillus wiedmannii]PGM80956.1 hypothetical protein CN957_12890 [Bacillus cereus]